MRKTHFSTRQLTSTQAEVEAGILVNILSDAEAKLLLETLADTIAELEIDTLKKTPGDVDTKVVVVKHDNTLTTARRES